MKNKILKTLLYLFIAGLLSGIGVYLYVFHKPHRNIAMEEPAYILSAEQLTNDFEKDENSAYERYGNKTLQVSGIINDINYTKNTASITLKDGSTGVNCSFDSVSVAKIGINNLKILKVNDSVNIKGKCDGYDMIMGVVLSRCHLETKN